MYEQEDLCLRDLTTDIISKIVNLNEDKVDPDSAITNDEKF